MDLLSQGGGGGGGGGGEGKGPKRVSWVTFDRDNILKQNFGWPSFN